MNFASLIGLLKQFGTKIEGNVSVTYCVNEDGLNIVASDPLKQWTARLVITKGNGVVSFGSKP
jgi:hypothetical protein